MSTLSAFCSQAYEMDLVNSGDARRPEAVGAAAGPGGAAAHGMGMVGPGRRHALGAARGDEAQEGRKRDGPPHLVPLAPLAVRILRELLPLTCGEGRRYVFPGLLSPERCMSEYTFRGALRRMGCANDTRPNAGCWRCRRRAGIGPCAMRTPALMTGIGSARPSLRPTRCS